LVRFPYEVGEAASGGSVSPCPDSTRVADPDSAAGQRARERYAAKYASCEAGAPRPQEPSPGSLSKAALKQVMSAHRADVDACYSDALDGWPDLAGKVGVQLLVDATGAVSEAWVVDSTLSVAQLGCCLREATRSWLFPPPSGGPALVTAPFAFTP